MDAALDELREKNTGGCPTGPEKGRAFGELMGHFVLGGDETCLLASDGTVSDDGGGDDGNVAAPMLGRGFRARRKRARSDEDSD